ncbi:hypothetical protein EF27_07245 [Salmonella enterica]|nr:hypothetical protein [Salmonella enterica]EBR8637499.1 hypothetical protein [Salmonella enterica subsp. enterica serovar Bareilly]EBZ6933045.1 hypothetical protein [Salmonella enterica subsp. enterica serovar Richmond]EBV4083584.1 hypothetical protein [Salmonella enterica subsp. enterica serovar Bareilly]ECB1994304.1 hypothetical protein [Salmonella enterica subsp. enterica serovar Bareilly]
MTTITREWLQQTIAEYEANRDELPFGLDTNSAIELQAFKLALASLEAEPVGFIARHKETGKFGSYLHPKADWFKNDDYEVLSAYTAQPAPVSESEPVAWTSEEALAEVCCDETGMIGPQYMVGNIPLYLHAQHAPVVPDECPAKIRELMASHSDALFNDGDAQEIWNACRTAMLQGVEQPQNARQNIPENIPDGNSPAIPDDWVMVPKEPTQAMIKAWLSEVANFRGHAAGYKAALAAAPQREVK